jgi:hypothetical protein
MVGGRLVYAWVLVGGVAACHQSSKEENRSRVVEETGPIAPVRPSLAPSRTILQNEARLVLENHCGACHIGAYPTARKGALRVFDLTELDWSARMTDAQLHDALSRIQTPRGDDGTPVTDTERATFAMFIDDELRRRAGASAPPPSCL